MAFSCLNFCAAAATILCHLSYPTLATFFFWIFMYYTPFVHIIAVINIVYYSILILSYFLYVLFALCSLCVSRTYQTDNDENVNPKSYIVFRVFLYLIVLGVSVVGLIFSIKLSNTGAERCPVEGDYCRLSLIICGVTCFLLYPQVTLQKPIRNNDEGNTGLYRAYRMISIAFMMEGINDFTNRLNARNNQADRDALVPPTQNV